MKRSLAAVLAATLAACAAGENAELACQQRLNAAADAPSAEADFGAAAYARLERGGCSAAQLALLDQLIKLTRDIAQLNAANEKAAASGDKDAHGAAFQKMNDAVIALDDLQRRVADDLAKMEQAQ